VKLRNEVKRETMQVTQTIFEGMEIMFIWYGHFLGMEGNRWFNRIMTWSPGRRRRRPPEMKWGKEAERVTNQRNLMSVDAANRQLRRLKTSGSPGYKCIDR